MRRRLRAEWERVHALPSRDVYAAMLAGYLVLRLASFVPSALSVTDTASYRRAASVALWDPDFYAGERAWTVPLFYKLVPADTARVVAQLVVSIVSWSVLAATLAGLVHPRVRPVAFAAVLLFSLAFDVVAWDSILLSESLSLSLAALVVAGWLRLVERPSSGLLVAVLAAMLFWVGTRDTNAAVALATVAFIAAWVVIAKSERRTALAALAGVALIGLAATASANAGRRWAPPLAVSIEYHILGDPDARAWFVEHGMPRTDQPLASEAWFDDAARRTYLEYLATHPLGTLSAPVRSLDRLDTLLAPDLRKYPEDVRETQPPLVADVLHPPSALTLFFSLVVVGFSAGVVGRRYGTRAIWAVPVSLVLLAVPHTLLAWHASGQEFGRHSLLGAVFVRLGVLILAVLVLDGMVRRRQPAPAKGRSA